MRNSLSRHGSGFSGAVLQAPGAALFLWALAGILAPADPARAAGKEDDGAGEEFTWCDAPIDHSSATGAYLCAALTFHNPRKKPFETGTLEVEFLLKSGARVKATHLFFKEGFAVKCVDEKGAVTYEVGEGPPKGPPPKVEVAPPKTEEPAPLKGGDDDDDDDAPPPAKPPEPPKPAGDGAKEPPKEEPRPAEPAGFTAVGHPLDPKVLKIKAKGASVSVVAYVALEGADKAEGFVDVEVRLLDGGGTPIFEDPPDEKAGHGIKGEWMALVDKTKPVTVVHAQKKDGWVWCAIAIVNTTDEPMRIAFVEMEARNEKGVTKCTLKSRPRAQAFRLRGFQFAKEFSGGEVLTPGTVSIPPKGIYGLAVQGMVEDAFKDIVGSVKVKVATEGTKEFTSDLFVIGKPAAAPADKDKKDGANPPGKDEPKKDDE